MYFCQMTELVQYVLSVVNPPVLILEVSLFCLGCKIIVVPDVKNVVVVTKLARGPAHVCYKFLTMECNL